VRCCVVRRLLRRCLILRLVVVFILFLLTDQLQSITDSINNLGVNVAYLKIWVFWWFRF